MDRQARTGDTVSFKSREMTGSQTPPVVAGRRRGKDDRKQNALAPLPATLELKEKEYTLSRHWI
jgi:hypothetical protein